MKTGICSDQFVRCHGFSIDAAYARIRELGYDTTDESLARTDEQWYHDTAVMEKYCAQIRAAAEKHGIEISQVHGPWPTKDTTEESRTQVWEFMHRAVYGTYLMGAKHLVIHPQMPFGHNPQDEDADAAEAMTVALMRDLMPDCEKYGVTLCLENMPFLNQRISVIERIVAAVAQVDSPNIGICLDTGHVNVFKGQDLGEAVRIAAPYLKVLHIHDNDGRRDAHRLPYLGTADWDSFAKALAEIGYTGTLSLETSGSVSPSLPPEISALGEVQTAAVARHLADEVERYKKIH